MPTEDAWGQGVQIATLTDPPNAETLARDLAAGLVPRSVLRFASASERGATLIGDLAPVPGMITYLTAEDRFDGYQAGGAWTPLTPGPWIPIEFSSGYVAYSGAPAYRLWGSVVELRGAVTRAAAGSYLTKATPTLFAALPTGYRPTKTAYLPAAVGSTTAPAGRLDVFTNGELRYLISAAATNDVEVFSFSGLRFSTS